jgi:hypothetical protein
LASVVHARSVPRLASGSKGRRSDDLVARVREKTAPVWARFESDSEMLED